MVPRFDHGPVPFLVIMVGSLALSLAGYELLRRARWSRFVLGVPVPRSDRAGGHAAGSGHPGTR